MRTKILAGMVVAIALTSSPPLLAQTVEELDRQTNELYEENKAYCLDEYGSFCTWFGCYGGHGITPTEITQNAISEARSIISGIVESNIEPWWSKWYKWNPPDNTAEYEKLAKNYEMFSTCNIEIEKWEFFPNMEDIPSYTSLKEDAKSKIETALDNIRMGQ